MYRTDDVPRGPVAQVAHVSWSERHLATRNAIDTASMVALPAAERPRERLAAHGPASLATAELLAIVIGSGTRGASAAEIGRRLLVRFGTDGLGRASIEELCQVPGCGPARAVAVKAAMELGRRAAAGPLHDSRHIRSPADAAALLGPEMRGLEQEHLRIILLNTRHRVLGVHEVYKGSLNASCVRAAEIFREPIRRNCRAILVAHNHPSGDPTPSSEDVAVTRRLVDVGSLLDIEVIDHVVIGDGAWVSLRERGLGFG